MRYAFRVGTCFFQALEKLRVHTGSKPSLSIQGLPAKGAWGQRIRQASLPTIEVERRSLKVLEPTHRESHVANLCAFHLFEDTSAFVIPRVAEGTGETGAVFEVGSFQSEANQGDEGLGRRTGSYPLPEPIANALVSELHPQTFKVFPIEAQMLQFGLAQTDQPGTKRTRCLREAKNAPGEEFSRLQLMVAKGMEELCPCFSANERSFPRSARAARLNVPSARAFGLLVDRRGWRCEPLPRILDVRWLWRGEFEFRVVRLQERQTPLFDRSIERS